MMSEKQLEESNGSVQVCKGTKVPWSTCVVEVGQLQAAFVQKGLPIKNICRNNYRGYIDTM